MLLGLRSMVSKVAMLAGLACMAACGEDPALGAGGEGDESGTTGAEGSTGEPASIDAQIEAFIAMRCERADACDCAGLVGSDDCVEADTATWEARIAAGEARELTRDDACITANLATLETAACLWPSAVLEGGEHLCTQYCAVYHGDRGMGESCEAYDSLVSDCDRGLLCDGGACVDPCARLTGLALGQTCGAETSGPFEDCASGGYCDFDTHACAALAQAGESCSDQSCADGLFCDWDSLTCVTGGDVGDSCAGTGYCREDLYCDYSDAVPTCRARGLAGQSCSTVPCAADLVCDGSVCGEPPPVGQACLSGTCEEGAQCDWEVNVCRALPTVGDPCPFGACANGSWCDTATVPEGVCSSLVIEGEACTGHAQCESGYCPRGYCEARPAEGEDCSVLFICARGLVCDGAMCQPTSYRGPAACVYPGW
jgi:hypothetical protein